MLYQNNVSQNWKKPLVKIGKTFGKIGKTFGKIGKKHVLRFLPRHLKHVPGRQRCFLFRPWGLNQPKWRYDRDMIGDRYVYIYIHIYIYIYTDTYIYMLSPPYDPRTQQRTHPPGQQIPSQYVCKVQLVESGSSRGANLQQLGNMCHWRLQSAEVGNLKWKQNAKIEEFRTP